MKQEKGENRQEDEEGNWWRSERKRCRKGRLVEGKEQKLNGIKIRVEDIEKGDRKGKIKREVQE